jgi:diacylglycerol kinase
MDTVCGRKQTCTPEECPGLSRKASAAQPPKKLPQLTKLHYGLSRDAEKRVDWYQIKLLVEHSSGVSMDALHVIVGVCAQLLVAAVCRTSVGRWLPWLAVLAIEIINEANDFRIDIWPDWGMQWGEAAKDVALTMALPTLLMIAVRLKPKLFASSSPAAQVRDDRQLYCDFP